MDEVYICVPFPVSEGLYHSKFANCLCLTWPISNRLKAIYGFVKRGRDGSARGLNKHLYVNAAPSSPVFLQACSNVTDG